MLLSAKNDPVHGRSTAILLGQYLAGNAVDLGRLNDSKLKALSETLQIVPAKKFLLCMELVST
jgi:hypothetical protein